MKHSLPDRRNARRPRGPQLSSRPAASPFRSHLPIPAQRERLKAASLGRRVALIAAAALAAGWVIATYAYRANRAAARSLDGAARTAAAFAGDLSRHDYWAAAAQLSPTAQRLHPAAAIKQDMQFAERQYGPIVRAEADSSAPRSVGGLQTCRAEYWLAFQHGALPLHLVLVRGYRHWSVESYNLG